MYPMIWRDRVGIEPTGDVTRLPKGFEDLEGHQYPIRPHMEKQRRFLL